MSENSNLPVVTYYTPVELIGIYRSYFERGKTNNVVWLRGIYVQKANQNRQWAYAYDELRDVNTNTTVTLKIGWQDRQRLKANSLIQVGGLIEINPFSNSTIQIAVNVTRFEIIKDQFVTEQDMKRQEIRISKSKKGFKNVDALLEDKLYKDERPKVALLFATTSITMSDFNAGVNAAAAKIDFVETRQPFSNAKTLSLFIQSLDKQKYDVIALIRGGGNGIEALDEIEVLETISNLDTPIICAIGHVGEELFLKSIADKVAPTPNGLGQYFSEMVERVISKRNNSRAVLIKEIENQFKKQIEESNKKNQELVKQIEGMRKDSLQQQKTYKETQEKILKDNKEALDKLQKQLKLQIDENAKQAKDFNENLKKMQDHYEEELKNRKGCVSGCLGMIAAIISIASLACCIIFLLI